jgi:UDP-N-acetylmuramate--alanine ligase
VDDLVLLEIYPARELPLEGITSQWLLNKITLNNKSLTEKEGVLEIIKNKQPELLLTVGAGDIDTLIQPLKQMLDHA